MLPWTITLFWKYLLAPYSIQATFNRKKKKSNGWKQSHVFIYLTKDHCSSFKILISPIRHLVRQEHLMSLKVTASVCVCACACVRACCLSPRTLCTCGLTKAVHITRLCGRAGFLILSLTPLKPVLSFSCIVPCCVMVPYAKCAICRLAGMAHCDWKVLA